MNYIADIGTHFLGSSHFLTKLSGGGQLVSLFLSNSIIIAGIILLFIIVFSGYSIINAHGDPQKMKATMHSVTWAVVGFLIVFATYFIIQIIGSVTGITITQ